MMFRDAAEHLEPRYRRLGVAVTVLVPVLTVRAIVGPLVAGTNVRGLSVRPLSRGGGDSRRGGQEIARYLR